MFVFYDIVSYKVLRDDLNIVMALTNHQHFDKSMKDNFFLIYYCNTYFYRGYYLQSYFIHSIC
jgi:hypothetical protein